MTYRVIQADCIAAMAEMEENSVDAIVTDPPYGLEFMGKEWDSFGAERDPVAAWSPGRSGDTRRHHDNRPALASLGVFQTWCASWATAALRVLKPGGHLLSFGGTRTYHRLTCALEDAGFEIRDCLAWLYGVGFPKSLDVSKAIDKAAGAEREIVGPNRYASRAADDPGMFRQAVKIDATAPATPDAQRWQGWGTALKPAFEPIVLARKPLSERSVAANVQRWGTGALNIDGCRIETTAGDYDHPGNTERHVEPARAVFEDRGHVHGMQSPPSDLGRWPPNVILDEDWEPVVRARYSVSDDASALLEGWFESAGYRPVPAVRGRDRRPAEPGETPEVLLSGLPGSVDVGEPARGSSPDARAEALARVPGEDERYQAADGQARTREPELEGVIPGPRVRDGQSTGRASDPGTPAGHGADPGPTAGTRGDRPPSERGQDGQPSREPDSDIERRAHQGTPAGLRGVADAPRPRREVLLRDVPPAWLTFFEFTGDVARIGAAGMLDEQTGERPGYRTQRHLTDSADKSIFGISASPDRTGQAFDDNGGASRFFYVPKADREERNRGLEGMPEGVKRILNGGIPSAVNSDPRGMSGGGDRAARNTHPTVKPVALMQWLVRMVTPPGGTVLDPFLGSGTTGMAACREGFDFIGIERESEYVEIARARIHGDGPLLNVEVMP